MHSVLCLSSCLGYFFVEVSGRWTPASRKAHRQDACAFACFQQYFGAVLAQQARIGPWSLLCLVPAVRIACLQSHSWNASPHRTGWWLSKAILMFMFLVVAFNSTLAAATGMWPRPMPQIPCKA